MEGSSAGSISTYVEWCRSGAAGDGMESHLAGGAGGFAGLIGSAVGECRSGVVGDGRESH